VDSSDLVYLPACELLRLFHAKKLSPVEVLRAQIERIHSIGQQVNALTHVHFDEAMVAARESEGRYMRGEPRPLEGITVALKDEYDRAGWITTAGSKLFADDEKKQNHPVVDKLLDAGAVLHVQTTAPEFYLLGVTWSDLWGVTRNPWNLAYTPGGSSGGSAAALASGMTTLATGSDMGGSIRIPCALTGLYGFKPPYGRVASPGESGLLVHASHGPMARNFVDMVLLQNVMSGAVPGSLTAIKPKLDLPLDYPTITGWKIAFDMTQGWAQLDVDVRSATFDALRALERAGAVIEEVDLKLATSSLEIRDAIEKALFSTALGAELAELAPQTTHLTTYAQRFVRIAAKMSPKDAHEAAEAAMRIHDALQQLVFQQGFKALVCPTVATTRIPADFDPTSDELIINGKKLDPYAGWFLTSVFSLLNWYPVINAPTGYARNGLPTGIQIVAAPYDDIAAATVASAYSYAATDFFAPDSRPQFRTKRC
jgi:amidase